MQSVLPAEFVKRNLLAPERRARIVERRLPSPALTRAYTLGGPKCHVCNCSGRIRWSLEASRAAVSAACLGRRCLGGILLARQHPAGIRLRQLAFPDT